jgi:SAM-dependent methyltransferase
MSAGTTAIWQDVECGSYEVDLPLWEELAERRGDPVLELGCGTGRVSLHLARRGHRVIGLDHDHELILELAERSRALPVEPLCANALDFELREPVALALAPMQFLQLLRSPDSRRRCLQRVAAALRPGGLLAAAIVRRAPAATAAGPPLPDVREIDGWVFSSLPTLIGWLGERLAMQRLRQTVSPEGRLMTEEIDRIELLWVEADDLEAEAESAGFKPAGRRIVPETDAHVGSTVVLLERSG